MPTLKLSTFPVTTVFSFYALKFFIPRFKVKQREGDEKKYGSDIESDSESEIYEENADGSIMLYTEMLEFVREGETIAKALKVSCKYIYIQYVHSLTFVHSKCFKSIDSDRNRAVVVFLDMLRKVALFTTQ